MDDHTEIHLMIKHSCLNIGARIIFLNNSTVPFQCSSITYVSHLRTCFISYRFIFLHRRLAKSYGCDDGRLLSLNPVALCSSLWPKQACLSHTFWQTAGISSAPGAMPIHEEQTRRLTLHWVLSQCLLETVDHSCSSPIPGQAQTTHTGLHQRLGEVAGNLETVPAHHRNMRKSFTSVIGDPGADILHNDRAADGGWWLESPTQQCLDKLDTL